MIIVKYGNFPLPYLNTEVSINAVMPPHTRLTLWLWCLSLILRWPLDLLELLTTVQKSCGSSTHFHVESLSLKSKGCRRRTMVLLTSCVGLYPDVHNQLDHTYHFWLLHFFWEVFLLCDLHFLWELKNRWRRILIHTIILKWPRSPSFILTIKEQFFF